MNLVYNFTCTQNNETQYMCYLPVATDRNYSINCKTQVEASKFYYVILKIIIQKMNVQKVLGKIVIDIIKLWGGLR